MTDVGEEGFEAAAPPPAAPEQQVLRLEQIDKCISLASESSRGATRSSWKLRSGSRTMSTSCKSLTSPVHSRAAAESC
jgi:hypothetical protein